MVVAVPIVIYTVTVYFGLISGGCKTTADSKEKFALVIFMCEPVNRQQAELQRQTIIHTNVYVYTN